MLPKVLKEQLYTAPQPQDDLITLQAELNADIEELDKLRHQLDHIKKAFTDEEE